MKEIKVFAPATVANLSCGFDVLGCCLDNVGDQIIVRENQLKKLRIIRITGQDLPLEIAENVAGVAVKALLEDCNSDQGFDIEIHKGIEAGSGIGSSAASSAGAVFAVNELLGGVYNRKQLIQFAMEGEQLASGNAHADNVAPALLGGFSLIRSYEPLDVLSLPVPSDLRIVVLHPKIEIKTSDSRSIIRQQVALRKAIAQWGNLGAFVSALYTNDYELLGRSLEDHIVEPARSILIPFFPEMKKLSIENGALGFGISGSGPSVFALCRGDQTALNLKRVLVDFYSNQEIAYSIHLSAINQKGVVAI